MARIEHLSTSKYTPEVLLLQILDDVRSGKITDIAVGYYVVEGDRVGALAAWSDMEPPQVSFLGDVIKEYAMLKSRENG